MYFPRPSIFPFCTRSSCPASERDTIYCARALRKFYMDDTDTIVILRPLPGFPQLAKSKLHLIRTIIWEVKMLQAFMNKTYNT